MFRRNFLFGKDGGTANLIDVGSEDLYQPGKGYGFVTEKQKRAEVAADPGTEFLF